MSETYDVAIIGGGINGCGIARDTAGRGLKVLLCEKDDLASATSSASTKLIHGGLRYLEHYEFKLVRESLSERETLWAMAPHIIWPLRFVLPHNPALRPAWMVRAGLFLYDHIGGRKLLPGTRKLDLRTNPAGAPLNLKDRTAFEYSDCWVNDARLVILNAVDAKARGAEVYVRTALTAARREANRWMLTLTDARTGQPRDVQARVVINAAGPWVRDVLTKTFGANNARTIRMVKGSHIVVPKLFDHDKAYIFQNDDQRIVFAIPYEDDFTLIGTTDVDFEGDPSTAKISESEIDYLCRLANSYFKKETSPTDVVWTYAGVRPLYDDGEGSAQTVTRDYRLDRTGDANEAVLLNIFGGKLTTYRRLAEDAFKAIEDCFPDARAPWTAGAHLPGGDFPVQGFNHLVDRLKSEYPKLDNALLRRLARAYGTRARKILDGVQDEDDLGVCFGHDLFGKEVYYLMQAEWAETAEDVAWRRSKLGLRLSKTEIDILDNWMANERANRSRQELSDPLSPAH